MADSTIQLIQEVKDLEKQLKELWEEFYFDMITTVVKRSS